MMQSNAKEQKKLKLQISRINNAKREQLGKIDQEMMSLRKQLLEDRKIFGTRSDIKRREDQNANILEGSSEDTQVHNVQPKLTGLQKHEVIDRNCFKPFQERSRHKAIEKHERKLSPSRFVPTVQEGIGSFKKKMPDVGMLPPSCSTPSLRLGRRHSIAEINLNDTLLSKLYPHRNSGIVPPKNTSLSSTMVGAGAKLDHPRLRQRTASLPLGLVLERAQSVDLPKLKTFKLQPERGKLAIDRESKANQNVKLGNFSRHVDGELKWKRTNSLPNFDNIPTNKDSMACKERLTARLMQSNPKPGSATNRNVASPVKPSIFGRHFKKNPTPVTEGTKPDYDENSESLGRVSCQSVEANEPNENEQFSSEQELSFIPKATLQEKMNKFFLEWVEGSEEEPRTDIEELLQEFRKDKVEKRRGQSDEAENDVEIDNPIQDMSQSTKDGSPEEATT